MIRIWKLEITGSFLLLAAWLNYLDRSRMFHLVLLSCMLHEIGHILAMEKMGFGIQKLRITAIGAEIAVVPHMGYWQEGLIALAGPGVNILLALLFCWTESGMQFSGINLILGCFNLLPAGNLDGGRAFRAALSLVAAPSVVALIGTVLNIGIITATIVVGTILFLQQQNITLLLIGGWLLSSVMQQKGGN